MKNIFKFALYTCLLTLPSIGFAGPISSGGGGATICRDSSGNITKAELLDIYEGRVRYNFNIPSHDHADAKSQMLTALERVSSPFEAALIKEAVGKMIASMKFLPAGTSLYAPPDMGNEIGVVLPTGCTIEAIGYYEVGGTLRVSWDSYSKLDQTNRAAFLLHEAIYKLARDTSGFGNSQTARIATAVLFAEGVDEGFRQRVLVKAIFSLEAERFWPSHENGTIIHKIVLPENSAKLTLTVSPSSPESTYSVRMGVAQFNNIAYARPDTIQFLKAQGTSSIELNRTLSGAPAIALEVNGIIWGDSDNGPYVLEVSSRGQVIYRSERFRGDIVVLGFARPASLGEIPNP